MSTWAQRAKAHFSQERQNSTTETTKTPLSVVLTVQSGGFCENQVIQSLTESEGNDLTPFTAVGQVLQLDAANDATTGTRRPPGLSPKLLAASLALDAQIHAADMLHGTTFTNSELDLAGKQAELTTARLHRFIDKGMSHDDAQALADRLALRDADDDRRVCLECTHLGGYGRTGWRCGNWQRAGVAIKTRDSQLPADLVQQLQRCDGFTSNQRNQQQKAREVGQAD